MNTNHIVSSFDRDLESIQARVMRMGGLVEHALRDAVEALEHGDIEAADAIRASDKAIDLLNAEIRTETARLLALRAPTAIDLRLVLSVIAISASLERIGDYAKNIAKCTPVIAGEREVEGSMDLLRRMTQFVIRMISDALDAYIQTDEALAWDVFERDQQTDQMYNTLFRLILSEISQDDSQLAAGMHLHFIAKNVERAGDHATSIAEQTIYMVTGALPDDDRPKGDDTSRASLETKEA